MNLLCGCPFSLLSQLLQEVHLDYVSCISSLSHLSTSPRVNYFFFFFFSVLPVSCFQPISLHPPHACSLSHVTPWTAARQAPPSMDFSRQEYWSGLPFPPPWDLPDPGIEPTFPALVGGFFTTATWEAGFPTQHQKKKKKPTKKIQTTKKHTSLSTVDKTWQGEAIFCIHFRKSQPNQGK